MKKINYMRFLIALQLKKLKKIIIKIYENLINKREEV